MDSYLRRMTCRTEAGKACASRFFGQSRLVSIPTVKRLTEPSCSSRCSLLTNWIKQHLRRVDIASWRSSVRRATGVFLGTRRRGDTSTVGLISDGSSERTMKRLTSNRGCWIVRPFFTPFPPIRSLVVSRRDRGWLSVSMDQPSVETMLPDFPRRRGWWKRRRNREAGVK